MEQQYKQHRFRLISPMVGNKIYSTTSLKHGAKKCLNELNSDTKKYDSFAMLDVDTYETYKFKLNYHPKNMRQHNLPNSKPFQILEGGADIYRKLSDITTRLSNVENAISNLKINSLENTLHNTNNNTPNNGNHNTPDNTNNNIPNNRNHNTEPKKDSEELFLSN